MLSNVFINIFLCKFYTTNFHWEFTKNCLVSILQNLITIKNCLDINMKFLRKHHNFLNIFARYTAEISSENVIIFRTYMK